MTTGAESLARFRAAGAGSHVDALGTGNAADPHVARLDPAAHARAGAIERRARRRLGLDPILTHPLVQAAQRGQRLRDRLGLARQDDPARVRIRDRRALTREHALHERHELLGRTVPRHVDLEARARGREGEAENQGQDGKARLDTPALALTMRRARSRVETRSSAHRLTPTRQGDPADMASKVRPLHNRIIVQRIKDEEKTKGGIIIPDSAKEKPTEGKVIAAGPGRRDEKGNLIAMDVKKGDRVLFGKYSGNEVVLDGEDHLIISEDDVLAILE